MLFLISYCFIHDSSDCDSYWEPLEVDPAEYFSLDVRPKKFVLMNYLSILFALLCNVYFV